MAETQIKEVSHRHEAIIDWLLANPQVKNLQVLCDRLNVSRSWLSIVMRSDAFRAEYEKRRDEYNQLHADKVQSRLYEVALKGIEKVLDALDADEVDPRFALDSVDKATNRLGFSPSSGSRPQVAINVGIVDKGLLASAREKMRQVTVVNVEPETCEEG